MGGGPILIRQFWYFEIFYKCLTFQGGKKTLFFKKYPNNGLVLLHLLQFFLKGSLLTSSKQNDLMLFKMKASLTKDICVKLDVNFSSAACNCSRPAVFRSWESVSLQLELLYPVEQPVCPLDLDILKIQKKFYRMCFAMPILK